MFHDSFADARHVEDAMEQVGGEVEVCRKGGDGITEGTHGLEILAYGEGTFANDGFLGGVGTAPMACPIFMGGERHR